MAEINCPNCGEPNPDTAEICANCGEPLGATGEWLNEIRGQAEGLEGSGESPFAPIEGGEPEGGAGDEPLAEGEVPDWLQRVRQRQAEDAGEQSAGDDDFASLRAGFSGEGQAESQDSQPEASEPPTEDEADSGMPSWLTEAEDAAPEQPEAAEPEAEGGLPHVPALLGGDAPGLDAAELGLPDWLGEIEPAEQSEAAVPDETLKRPRPGAGGATPDIERATLPNWLEAMRPVDTFRSVVQIDAEEDQAIESVGPLAGLRGVLAAEPVVAMPRTSTVGAMQLEVSERQYAQAELLHNLISEEERSEPAAPKRRIRLAFFRWAIAAVTIVAAALPVMTGSPGFALPALEPKELGALFDLVGGLPTDRPTLFVFDYDPGYAGELDAVSGPLVEQVMSRGLPVVSMSTRPTGPPLAMHAMQDYAVRHGYVEGTDLVHLGYLSGGQAAVQLFASNPRGAVLKGFGLPESMREAGQGIWDTAALQNVNALSDFGMVAVITGGADTARVWIEQTGSELGDTPLVMVLSAGVEPLIRPYYEADQPQISGILTGVPAAVAYETRNGRFGAALDHWNSFGTGMLAAELVLLAGTVYGLARWVLTRRES